LGRVHSLAGQVHKLYAFKRIQLDQAGGVQVGIRVMLKLYGVLSNLGLTKKATQGNKSKGN